LPAPSRSSHPPGVDDELEWLRFDPLEEGASVFADGPPEYDAQRSKNQYSAAAFYADGFRRAGEVLGKHALAQSHDIPTLVMPILYCYRHWLELRLKYLVLLGGEWNDETLKQENTHDLATLWGLVRPTIEDAYPNDDRDELDRVEAVVLELAKADPSPGVAFRYSHYKAGRPTLASIAKINVKTVVDVMEKVGATLDGASAGMEEMLDQRKYGEYPP
jgi:hypothetical protein